MGSLGQQLFEFMTLRLEWITQAQACGLKPYRTCCSGFRVPTIQGTATALLKPNTRTTQTLTNLDSRISLGAFWVLGLGFRV